MNLAVVHTRALTGVDALPVTVEVHLSGGLPAMSIVGLAETAVRESKDRVRAAIVNSQFTFPVSKITVNLAPADLPKTGGRYDLAIALGVLAASGQLPVDALCGYEFVGELALGGSLRPVRGALPTAVAVAGSARTLIVPEQNAGEAALAGGANVLQASNLLQVIAHLTRQRCLPRGRKPHDLPPRGDAQDLEDVRGQHQAKRALEIAAAGAHNLLLVGPPGTGKTMLASRLIGILPPLDEAEAVESAAIASLGGRFDAQRWRQRPFRQPHHTASAVALVGGGSTPRPGEVSLAHQGVLFLDELPEFSRKVLEVLREPLENGCIVISRAAGKAEFPARFQLVAAMNPCPCGFAHDPQHQCRCSPTQIERYLSRLSGPLLDRIDLHVRVPRLSPAEIRDQPPAGCTSQQVRARVSAARHRQLKRCGKLNAHLSNAETERHPVHPNALQLLDEATHRLQLSPRAYHRTLRVARTIADLADSEGMIMAHVAEAIALRGERPTNP
ncbi:MAG: YifB family Mg chelatase-like AAA ATPase [Gammaproteobacteria bacterium]|nr:YifB family Mg chelatase-like AAA ATPase [Gammaproteobacteria bacterium]